METKHAFKGFDDEYMKFHTKLIPGENQLISILKYLLDREGVDGSCDQHEKGESQVIAVHLEFPSLNQLN